MGDSHTVVRINRDLLIFGAASHAATKTTNDAAIRRKAKAEPVTRARAIASTRERNIAKTHTPLCR
jgi:hypothetical protein